MISSHLKICENHSKIEGETMNLIMMKVEAWSDEGSDSKP